MAGILVALKLWAPAAAELTRGGATRSCLPAASLRVILRRLTDYADLHLAREERIQLAMGFTLHSEHELSHTNLREYLKDLCVEFEHLATVSEGAARLEHLVESTRRWLVEHLMQEDMSMKPLLARLPPTFAA